MVVPLPDPDETPEDAERPEDDELLEEEPEEEEADEPDEDLLDEDLLDEDLLEDDLLDEDEPTDLAEDEPEPVDDEPELARFTVEEVDPVLVLVCAFVAAEAWVVCAPTTAAVAVAAVAASAVVQVSFLTRRRPAVLAWTACLKWELVIRHREAGQVLIPARRTSELPQNQTWRWRKLSDDGGCS